jgi:Cu/Ag efflux protein CusF
MLRKFLCALVAVMIGVGVMFADEFKGTVTKADDKGLVVKVGDKDKKVAVGKDTKVVDADGKPIKASAIKEGAKVTVTFEKEGKKTIIKEIKVDK